MENDLINYSPKTIKVYDLFIKTHAIMLSLVSFEKRITKNHKSPTQICSKYFTLLIQRYRLRFSNARMNANLI